MRYVRILRLHFEDVLETRSRAFVYFLLNIINPLILILFWKGAFGDSARISGFTHAQINSYYLLLVIVITMTLSHIEENIAKDHIRNGELVRFLTRPFPYLLLCFFTELPHRIVQGVYGILAFLILSFFISGIPDISISATSLSILMLAYVLCFLIQATISLFAFWIVDMNGLLNVWEVARAVLSGILVPLTFLPDWLSSIAYALPFAYIIYFPVISFQGIADMHTQLWIICMQLLWICVFWILYKVLWHFGIKKFSGVGQ